MDRTTVTVDKDTRKKLNLIKIEEEFDNLDQVIELLLEEYYNED